MSGSDQQIVTSYEDLGMSVEEIASDTGWDELAIKAILIQNSMVYRDSIKSPVGGNENDTSKIEGFSEQDNLDAIRTVREILNASDEPHIQLKAAMFIRNDKKGRLDVVKAIKDAPRFTINQFNITLAKARDARLRARSKVIDIGGTALVTSNQSNAQKVA